MRRLYHRKWSALTREELAVRSERRKVSRQREDQDMQDPDISFLQAGLSRDMSSCHDFEAVGHPISTTPSFALALQVSWCA